MNTYKKIIKHFGEDNQINKAQCELIELRNELYCYQLDMEVTKRTLLFDRENFIGEIADVLNMIIQLTIIFKISWWKIIKAMIGKNKRTLERIKEGYYE